MGTARITTKVCSTCKVEKPVSEFRFSKVQNDYISQCKLHIKLRNIRRKFGISEEQYFELLRKQGSKCAICGKQPLPGEIALAVDHDHETNRIRGLLCYSCNTKLGWYEKFTEQIRKYL